MVGQYAQACVQAAGQSGADVLDLWTLMQKDEQVRSTYSMYCVFCEEKTDSSSPLFKDYTVYLSDGLHLSEKGNQFVAQHLWSLLESRVVDLPFILPYWGDVDSKSPESSLLCDQQ